MRIPLTLIPAVLLAACGSDPATSATAASTSGTDTQASSGTTQDGPATGTTAASTIEPTGASITGGMTEALTSTSSTGTPDTGTADTGTTSPVQTDTGPGETGTTTGTTTGDTSTGDTTGTTTGTTTDASSSSSSGDDSTTAVEEACPCPDIEVPLDDGIFVLAQNASLWKYFPEGNNLVMLGVPKCDLPPLTFSMAVDRSGFAWLQYSSGDLRKVAVSDLDDCSNPGYLPNQQGIFNFGMAFVSNSGSDKCDRIFGDEYTGIAESPNGASFFSIDPMTQQIVKLGDSDFGTAEVTGTGDGRAFLFAPSVLSKLVEVDKATGNTISSIPLPGITAGGGWAFAFFAGDFYFFTDGEYDGLSEVTHIDYDDSNNDGQQEITVVINDAPLKIVGAGVSTCAPTLPQ